jgi:hypothetical protein
VPPVALRPRSTTELIDAAVQLLRQHYVELVTTSAIFLMPGILLALFMPEFRTGLMPSATQGLFFVVALFISAMFSIMSTAAIVVVVSDSYLGREVSIASAVQRVFDRFGSVFLAAFLQSIAIAIGIVLFVIPGFLCIAWFFAATAVVVIEGKTAGAAMSRSKELASGSVGRILGVLLLSVIILAAFQLIITFCFALLGQMAHLDRAITGLAANLANLLIYPFATVVITLLYYDLRIRKEGFDLEMMATELGSKPASPAPAR